jgi:hypothetical protein
LKRIFIEEGKKKGYLKTNVTRFANNVFFHSTKVYSSVTFATMNGIIQFHVFIVEKL